MSLNVDGYTWRRVGHLPFQTIFFGQLKDKGTKADTLNNTIDFQPFGNTIFCHGIKWDPRFIVSIIFEGNEKYRISKYIGPIYKDRKIRNSNI